MAEGGLQVLQKEGLRHLGVLEVQEAVREGGDGVGGREAGEVVVPLELGFFPVVQVVLQEGVNEAELLPPARRRSLARALASREARRRQTLRARAWRTPLFFRPGRLGGFGDQGGKLQGGGRLGAPPQGPEAGVGMAEALGQGGREPGLGQEGPELQEGPLSPCGGAALGQVLHPVLVEVHQVGQALHASILYNEADAPCAPVPGGRRLPRGPPPEQRGLPPGPAPQPAPGQPLPPGGGRRHGGWRRGSGPARWP
jgi:hypothetical protein